MLPEQKVRLYKGLQIGLIAFLVGVGISFLVETVRVQSNKPENTISFSGHGEISAVPDIASVSFTIRKEAKTVKEAQDKVAEVEKKVLDFLKENKIEEKDIKTNSASFNPKYEYKYYEAVACNQYGCPPTPGKSVISGYEAYENITVKIRNTDDAGKIIQGIGSLGVSELNGPNFTVEKEDSLKAQARKEAIDEAKAKAKVLAKDLGVRLGKITSFNESGNYPVPMYDRMMVSAAGGVQEKTAELPKGENLITSNVTITYEIK